MRHHCGSDISKAGATAWGVTIWSCSPGGCNLAGYSWTTGCMVGWPEVLPTGQAASWAGGHPARRAAGQPVPSKRMYRN